MNNKTILPLLCFLLLLPFISAGQLKFLNKCNRTAYVAIRYIESEFDGSNWTTIGWFEVNPNQTILVVDRPLINRYLYFYAFSKDNQVLISGDNLTCASYEQFRYYSGFTYRSNDYCPIQLPFTEVDTKNLQKFICNLCSK